MWGRPIDTFKGKMRHGNTPTHVGKTGIEDALIMPEWETPPRMWGRQDIVPKLAALLRNTPTHVGKTHDYNHGRGLVKKHPHACGEDQGC